MKPQKIPIRNGVIVTMDPQLRELARGDMLIDDGRIVAIAESIPGVEDAEIIDATNFMVLPDLVDTHRHTWQSLFRNVASDWSLSHYFTGLHGTVSELYTPEDTYAGNLLGTLEALNSGITTTWRRLDFSA